MPEFKYDVAFSFLSRDEPLAVELAGLFSGRLKTFVYSKQQEQVAGTDGEKTFGLVFGEQARVVVVLYRDGWGQTPWTRIEETAIRNRAYDEGYEFVLLVPLEKGLAPPKWLPKTQIWIGLERWGPQAAAAIIEARVTQAGGEVSVESALDRAGRLAREDGIREERGQFLRSQRGVDAANEELNTLFDELETLAKQIGERHARWDFRIQRQGRRLALYSNGRSLSVVWSLQWGNSLDQSSLYIKVLRGALDFGWASSRLENIREWDYDFDRLPNGTLGWHRKEPDDRFFQSKALADHHLTDFIDEFAENADDA